MIIYGKYKLGNIFVPFVCYRRGHLRSNRSNTSASDDYFKCFAANFALSVCTGDIYLSSLFSYCGFVSFINMRIKLGFRSKYNFDFRLGRTSSTRLWTNNSKLFGRSDATVSSPVQTYCDRSEFNAPSFGFFSNFNNSNRSV